MRSLGIRSLAVTCELCHHAAVVDVETVRAGGSTFDVVRKKITEAGRHALAAGSQK